MTDKQPEALRDEVKEYRHAAGAQKTLIETLLAEKPAGAQQVAAYAAPQFPGHPEPMVMDWSAIEISVIAQYGRDMYEAGKRASHGQAPASTKHDALPPLPSPDMRDVGTRPQDIQEFLMGYATEYARTALAAQQVAALAKPYCHEDCMAYTAGIEKELQDTLARARPTPTHLEAMERAWLWMENQADSQSKGGHATFDLMMLREERDALRAAIDAAPTTQPTDRHALQAEGKHPAPCARFCEANAFRADRRSDTALIRQLLEALQANSAALWEIKGDPETPVTDAVNAARARLEEKP